MEQVEMNNMYINIDGKKGSEKYTKKNTAASGKLIKAVYGSYECVLLVNTSSYEDLR